MHRKINLSMPSIFSSYRAIQRSLATTATTIGAWLAALVILVVSPQLLRAQNVPIISGGVGILDTTNAGVNFFQPVVAPVIVAPFRKFLFESRFDLREFYIQQNGGYQGTFFGSTQYLQLDYIASRHLTVTAGRFLTPFGTYNERLTAIWIPNFQNAPLHLPDRNPHNSFERWRNASRSRVLQALRSDELCRLLLGFQRCIAISILAHGWRPHRVLLPQPAPRDRNVLFAFPSGHSQQFRRRSFLVAALALSAADTL